MLELLREGVTGAWLDNLYCSPDIVKEEEMDGACSIFKGAEKYVRHFHQRTSGEKPHNIGDVS